MITIQKVISSIEMRFTKQGDLRGVAVYERLITMENGARLEGSKDQELDPRPLSVDDAETLSFLNEVAMSALTENVRLVTELAASVAALEPLKNDLQESRHQVALLRAEIEAMKSVLVTQ